MPLLPHTRPGLSYFHLSRRFGLFSGLAKVVKALLGLSNVCTTPDNAAYDMTVHAALRINKVGGVWGWKRKDRFRLSQIHQTQSTHSPTPSPNHHHDQVTTTYPGLFYFSFVGTCARHRSSSPAAEEEKEGGNGDSSNSGSSPLSTPSIDREQPQSQRLTALVKFLAYRLMAWHVRGVKFESGGTGEGVFAMLGPEANAAATRWAEDGASDGEMWGAQGSKESLDNLPHSLSTPLFPHLKQHHFTPHNPTTTLTTQAWCRSSRKPSRACPWRSRTTPPACPTTTATWCRAAGT